MWTAGGMMNFICTNPAIREILRSIVSEVLEAGGYVHPTATIVEEKGQMTVFCHDKSHSRVLFCVPPEALLPIEDAEWEEVSGRMAAICVNSLEKRRAVLLMLMVELYNEASKLSEFKEISPRHALGRNVSISEIMALIRPDASVAEEDATRGFLKSRVFSIAPAYPNLGGKSVLMPLIDLLNHHPSAGHYSLEKTGLGVSHSTPNGDGECFVSYRSRLDPVTLAWYYGYAEERSPFATSAPVSILINGLGRLTIGSKRMKSSDRLNLPAVTVFDDGVSFSHLIVDRREPSKTGIGLKLGITALCQRKRIPLARVDQFCEQAFTAIYSANACLLRRLERAILALDNEPAATRVLLRASEIQRRNLHEALMANAPPAHLTPRN